MRSLARVFTVLAVLLGGLLGLGATANADPATTPSTDPVSDDYSPWAWMTFWAPTGENYPTAAAGGLQDGLTKTGMVIAVQPEQFAASRPDDVAAAHATVGQRRPAHRHVPPRAAVVTSCVGEDVCGSGVVVGGFGCGGAGSGWHVVRRRCRRG